MQKPIINPAYVEVQLISGQPSSKSVVSLLGKCWQSYSDSSSWSPGKRIHLFDIVGDILFSVTLFRLIKQLPC